MNQPLVALRGDITDITDDSTIPANSPLSATGTTATVVNSSLTNLFRRLRKSEKARGNTRGAFGGGKRRSARHAGLV